MGFISCSAREWHPDKDKFGVWKSIDSKTLAVVYLNRHYKNKETFSLMILPSTYSELYSYRSSDFNLVKPDLYQNPYSEKTQLIIDKDKLTYKFAYYKDKTTGEKVYLATDKSAFTKLVGSIEKTYLEEKDPLKKLLHESFYDTFKDILPK